MRKTKISQFHRPYDYYYCLNLNSISIITVMGFYPDPRNGDFDTGLNCLTCYPAFQTPTYHQAVIYDMRWAIDPEPFDNASLIDGVPIVLKQGTDFIGGNAGKPCVWGGSLPANGWPGKFWTCTYLAAGIGSCYLILELNMVPMFFQLIVKPPCTTTFDNSGIWPILGGVGIIEANESINKTRYDLQQAGNETTDRASILLKDYNLFDFEGEDFYERWFLYNNQTILALRNRVRSNNILVRWDEKKFQE